MTTNPALRRALGYAAASWPVFRCTPGEKVPATAHGCHDATTGPEIIARWWRRDPAARRQPADTMRSRIISCNFCNQCCIMHYMAAHDICADIAAVLNPLPAHTDDDDEHWSDAALAVLGERDDEAGALRLSWEEGGIDPLLSTLAGLRAQRLKLEADMRLLIAYARRFTHPRPYKLIDLAEAAGMSISGVRIAYDDEELDQLAELLGRPPAPAAGGEPQQAAAEG